MPTIDRELLEKPFPDNLIRSRKGPFGQTFSYVEGHEVIKRLNAAFAGQWSIEIVEHLVREAEVVVLAKLVADGVTKMAFGGSSITVSREGEVISIADDLKAAATDALKKAASLMGVGLHLYSSDRPAEKGTSRDARPGNGNSRPRQDGNGRGNGNGRRHGATGTSSHERLTQKQLSCIWSMGRSLGQNVEAIRERSVQVFGVQPEHLTKTDASSFIQELGEALSGPAASAS